MKPYQGAACAVLLALSFRMTSAADHAPRITLRDVITDQAARGDGGNAWGPHKCRIVRTADGVFSVYTATGGGHLHREWRLMWRDDAAGKWVQLAAGDAGREPPNLLATPDGTLHLLGWPGGPPRHWWGTPRAGRLELQSEVVPGLDGGDWPYSAAGADLRGNLCVLSVSAGEKPGGMRWVSRDAAGGWSPARTAAVDYRCCYAFLFPEAGGGLTLAATRDVKWDVLGYSLPAGVIGYAFDEARSWHAAPDGTLTAGVSILEKPTDAFPNVMRMVHDAYVDTAGRLHLVCAARGAATMGEPRLHHAIVSSDGKLLADQPLPENIGEMARIFQDDRGGFWLLGSAAVLSSGEADDAGSLRFADPVKLDLGGRRVQREGFFLAVPRTGTSRGSAIDAVFPTGEVTRESWQTVEKINAGHPGWHDWNLYAPEWVYVRIQLYDEASARKGRHE